VDLLFTDRIARRTAAWWWERAGLRARAHRFRELILPVAPGAPDVVWRCCAFWPRRLIMKLNGRAFAVQHGCRLPKLLWKGRRAAALPWDRLPARFVVKPALGTGGRGAIAVWGDRELLGATDLAPADRGGAEIRATHRGLLRHPLLAEEFVVDPAYPGTLPTEYKCYLFGGTVGCIEVFRRAARDEASIACYAADWRPMPEPFRVDKYRRRDPEAPPACLPELLAQARRLGAAIGTFMRVDFYVTAEGPTFSEFASTPSGGLHYTDFANRYLGELWQRHCPDLL
jgi:hypothetical protein